MRFARTLLSLTTLAACSSSSALPPANANDGGPNVADASDIPDVSPDIPDVSPGAPDASPDVPSRAGVVDPGVISASGMSVSEHEPYIAAAMGHVGIAWIARQSPNLFIGYRISLDDGETWAPIGMLPLPPNNNVGGDPFLAADANGTLFIAWLSEQKSEAGARTNLHVFVAKAAAGATSFDTPVEVTDPSVTGVGIYDQPKIAATPAGALIVTYTQVSADSSSMVIVTAFSLDGQQWTRTNVAGPGAAGSYRNRAVVCDSKNTGDRIFMQYLEDSTGVALRWSDDGGRTWPAANRSTAQAPAETSTLTGEIGCAASGNDVWVFYTLSTDTSVDQKTTIPKGDSLRLAHSGDRGATFDRRIDAHDAAAGKYFLMGSFVREESGALDVTYYAGNASGDVAGSYRRAHSTDGTSFAPNVLVHQPLKFETSRTAPTWIGDYVGLAASAGNLHMAYADTSGSAAHIAYYRTSNP